VNIEKSYKSVIISCHQICSSNTGS